MSRPKNAITWATGNFPVSPGDPWSGAASKIAPSLDYFLPHAPLAARHVNYWISQRAIEIQAVIDGLGQGEALNLIRGTSPFAATDGPTSMIWHPGRRRWLCASYQNATAAHIWESVDGVVWTEPFGAFGTLGLGGLCAGTGAARAMFSYMESTNSTIYTWDGVSAFNADVMTGIPGNQTQIAGFTSTLATRTLFGHCKSGAVGRLMSAPSATMTGWTNDSASATNPTTNQYGTGFVEGNGVLFFWSNCYGTDATKKWTARSTASGSVSWTWTTSFTFSGALTDATYARVVGVVYDSDTSLFYALVQNGATTYKTLSSADCVTWTTTATLDFATHTFLLSGGGVVAGACYSLEKMGSTFVTIMTFQTGPRKSRILYSNDKGLTWLETLTEFEDVTTNSMYPIVATSPTSFQVVWQKGGSDGDYLRSLAFGTTRAWNAT